AHLHPDRLGHGVRASEDPRLLEHLVDDGIAFEVCPASNVSLGVYEDAPTVLLSTLMGAGAQIALGADDPLLFGSRLLDQYRIAREVHGWTGTELAELAASSIRASRAGAAAKERLLKGVQDWLASPAEVPAEQVRASGLCRRSAALRDAPGGPAPPGLRPGPCRGWSGRAHVCWTGRPDRAAPPPC